jgi:hypothetical protein
MLRVWSLFASGPALVLTPWYSIAGQIVNRAALLGRQMLKVDACHFREGGKSPCACVRQRAIDALARIGDRRRHVLRVAVKIVRRNSHDRDSGDPRLREFGEAGAIEPASPQFPAAGP